jgi:hypothetical protein
LASCIKLWENIPQQFRQQKSSSNFWVAYSFITEQTQQNELVGKETGQSKPTWKDGIIQLGSG